MNTNMKVKSDREKILDCLQSNKGDFLLIREICLQTGIYDTKVRNICMNLANKYSKNIRVLKSPIRLSWTDQN